MALLFLEGFEGYGNTTDMANTRSSVKYFSVGAALNSTTYRSTQTTTANSRSLTATNASSVTVMNLPGVTEVIFGMAINISALTFVNPILTVYSDYNNSYGSNNGVGVWVNASGQFVVQLTGGGTGNTTYGTSTATINTGVWHYLEFRAKYGYPSSGQAEVRLDGVQILNISAVQTGSSGYSNYNFATFCSPYYAATYYVDDMYVIDTTGTVNNTFLGQVGVYTLYPTGAGSSTQFTQTGSSSNWQAVAETAPDTSTYVSSATSGQKDYYTFQSLPAGLTTVSGVMVKAKSLLSVAGTRQIKHNLYYTGTEILGAARSLITGTWMQDGATADQAPGAVTWTPTIVNSTQGGISST